MSGLSVTYGEKVAGAMPASGSPGLILVQTAETVPNLADVGRVLITPIARITHHRPQVFVRRNTIAASAVAHQAWFVAVGHHSMHGDHALER